MTSSVRRTERINVVTSYGWHLETVSNFFQRGLALWIILIATDKSHVTSAHFSVLGLPCRRGAHTHHGKSQHQRADRLEISRKTNDFPGWPWGQRTRFLEDLFELLCLSISFWTLRHLAEHFQQSLLRFQVNFYCSNCVAEGLLQLSQVWVVWIDSAFGLWLLSHQQSIVATQR